MRTHTIMSQWDFLCLRTPPSSVMSLRDIEVKQMGY